MVHFSFIGFADKSVDCSASLIYLVGEPLFFVLASFDPLFKLDKLCSYRVLSLRDLWFVLYCAFFALMSSI